MDEQRIREIIREEFQQLLEQQKQKQTEATEQALLVGIEKLVEQIK